MKFIVRFKSVHKNIILGNEMSLINIQALQCQLILTSQQWWGGRRRRWQKKSFEIEVPWENCSFIQSLPCFEWSSIHILTLFYVMKATLKIEHLKTHQLHPACQICNKLLVLGIYIWHNSKCSAINMQMSRSFSGVERARTTLGFKLSLMYPLHIKIHHLPFQLFMLL